MGDLTIDVDILMFGCSLADDYSPPCFLLMEEIAKGAGRKVVFDEAGLIQGEYDRKLRGDEYGQSWLRHIVNTSRYHPVRRANPSKRVKQKLLGRYHFDTKDFNRYVRPAAASEDKLLVTHDPGYSGPIRQELKSSLKVSVHSAASVHQIVCVHPIDRCLALLELRAPASPPAGTGSTSPSQPK